MNKTKYFYDFILRKNELSDELYDLKDNITKLDMLVNENMGEFDDIVETFDNDIVQSVLKLYQVFIHYCC